jgi:hypothetical protein
LLIVDTRFGRAYFRKNPELTHFLKKTKEEIRRDYFVARCVLNRLSHALAEKDTAVASEHAALAVDSTHIRSLYVQSR